MGRLNPGRRAAGRALLQVERGDRADQTLAKLAPAEEPDRGLAWHLTLGVLRKRGLLDCWAEELTGRPMRKLDPPVRVALRVGLYERGWSRTASHALVDQAVQLCKVLGGRRAHGLVNAVLRRAKEPPSRGPEINHPEWLTQRWQQRLGGEGMRRWCEHNDRSPPLVLCWRGESEEQQGLQALETMGLPVQPGRAAGELVPRCWSLGDWRGRVTELPGFDAGWFWVMDPAAAAASDLVQAQPGVRVLDACAAPGGKSFRLHSQGARVTAADRSERRLRDLRASGERLKMELEIWEEDWTQSQRADRFDAILLDAPCTGLGTLRRNPEIRWLRREEDLRERAALQSELLDRMLTLLRPGGALIYSVCSSEPEEGEDQVSALLDRHPGLSLEQTLITAPPTDEEDAFFAARLRKEAG